MIKKYYIYTWGCAMNTADSQRIAGWYESNGFIQAATADEANEIISSRRARFITANALLNDLEEASSK